VDQLLAARLGPILVFAMTKPRALSLAEEFASRRERTADGAQYVDQLELFSEPSALIRTLGETALRKVAFHTADLTFAERELVERGLVDRLFDVVFATPTLAAGVNFPFQTVLFDAFYRGFIPADPWLPLADFQNMAGRAGRLGLHDKGYAVLLATTEVEFDRARTLVTSHVEPLYSKFLTCSLRKVVLTIIASQVVRTLSELQGFLEDTLWWYQTRERNPKKLADFPSLLTAAVGYLKEHQLLTTQDERVFATRLGVATAASGLLPSTVIDLLAILREHQGAFAPEDNHWITATIHAAVASAEFASNGQRFLPYARSNQPERNASVWIRNQRVFLDIDAVEAMDRVTNATFGLCQWIAGTKERVLRHVMPAITYGQMQQLGDEVAWILDGIARVARVPEAGCQVAVANSLNGLAERLRYGVPSELLDVLRAAYAYAVPGFRRQRAMALLEAGTPLPNDVLRSDREELDKLLESSGRAESLLNALIKYFDAPLEVCKIRHAARAKDLPLDPSLIRSSYDALGTDYENSIQELLTTVQGWQTTKLDKGKRQGFPDILLEFQGTAVLLECKTKQKNTATIGKDDAFAVLTKGSDFKKDHCVTIGKPDFDETSKLKANGSSLITLVRHHDFIEAILRHHAGKVDAATFFAWLVTAGYARLDHLDTLVEATCGKAPKN